MSGRLCCGKCGIVLHDPRPRGLSAVERVAQATYERRDPAKSYTGAEVDALLNRINSERPSAVPWTPETARVNGGLPKNVNSLWTLNAEDKAVLVLRCPRCRDRYSLSDSDMRRRVAEAIQRGEDVYLTC